ncbi:MAG: GAF domain-containing protein [Elusimicrobia bacterium]|nr:GAF domain-containing protein [Elusimicrobiota bacterium]
MAAFYILAFVCAGLIVALWWALARVEEATKAAARKPVPGPVADTGRLESRLGALLAMHERGRPGAGTLTLEAFGKGILEAACSAVSADQGALLLYDGARETLVPLAAHGSDDLGRRETRPGEGPAGRAYNSGKLERSSGAGVPFVSLPLSADGETHGVLCLYRLDGTGTLDSADERFLSLLARQAAATLHQQDQLEQQESFSIEMMQVLARAAEAKDHALGSSERARAVARKVAETLGLDSAQVRQIEYAAMLHRVGKIGVDQTLLSKPGKLSPDEYEKIKKYTTIGAQILSKAKSLEPVARIVLHQQEWFNGKGYPEGLKGDAIPVGSRIVSIMNAWEAMMQDRPYRKALSPEVARAELKKGAGQQFDPAVVEAFLKVVSAEPPA